MAAIIQTTHLPSASPEAQPLAAAGAAAAPPSRVAGTTQQVLQVEQKFTAGSQTAPLSSRKVVFLYKGEGATEFCVKETRKALKEHMDESQAVIQEFEREQELPDLDINNHFVVLPGGLSHVQRQNLFPVLDDKIPRVNTPSQKRLSDFFRHGNTLGLCAGAIVVTAFVQNMLQGLYMERDLKENDHIPVASAGPIEPPADRVKYPLAVCAAKTVTVANRTFAAYYCLGPWFIKPEKLPPAHKERFHSFETIASYSDKIKVPVLVGWKTLQGHYEDSDLPAVVEWVNPVKHSSGKQGKAILASCHTEITVEGLNGLLEQYGKEFDEATRGRVKGVIAQLSTPETIANNKLLFRQMMQRLGIPLKG